MQWYDLRRNIKCLMALHDVVRCNSQALKSLHIWTAFVHKLDMVRISLHCSFLLWVQYPALHKCLMYYVLYPPKIEFSQ